MEGFVQGLNRFGHLKSGFKNVSKGIEEINTKIRPHFISSGTLATDLGGRGIVKDVVASERMLMKALSNTFLELLDDIEFVGKSGYLYKPTFKNIAIPFNTVISELRMGNLNVLIDASKMIKETASSPSTLKRIIGEQLDNAIVKDMFRECMERTFPDRKLHIITEGNAKLLKDHLDDNILKTQIDTDAIYGNIDKLYKTNVKFKKFIDKLTQLPKKLGKEFLSVKGLYTSVILGGGAYALIKILMANAEKMAGCWRISLAKNGTFNTCKIPQSSCESKKYDIHQICVKVPPIIEKGGKNILTNTICDGWKDSTKDIGNSHCRRCNTQAPKNSLQYLPIEDMVDPHDQYVCKPMPDVGTVLGDFVGNLPEEIWDGVNKTVDIITDVFKYVVIFLLGGILIFLVLKMRDIYKQMHHLFISNNPDADYSEKDTEVTAT